MSLKKETPSDQQLHLAALQGNLEQLKKVIDTGKVHVDCKDKEGTTPLILAAANNHLECVKELLKQGADPGARRLTGTCALFFAAQGGFLDIVKVLVSHGAPVDLPSYDGGTPLFVACQCNHLDVVKELLDAGSDIHCQMVDGATSLFITAQNGHLKLLKFLIEKGADIDMKRKDNATALWIAAQMGHANIVRELISAGSDIDAVREDGATPLFKACHKGHLEVVEELLKHKPRLGLLPNGETALHAAALFGHMKITKLLMAANADGKLKNKEGQTAAELAREAGYDYIAKFIEGYSTSNGVNFATNGTAT
ncbi:hypothetical protein ACJMK2_041685 [Sinanodonta woodiana]|uniref:Ankyrin repeat domain-containing protein 29 n=1 Tax=Sinanodonta woodiana TaxID=1069815 RepID=A0ABD3W871_SINWO